MSMQWNQRGKRVALAIGLLGVWMALGTGYAEAQEEMKECELDQITLVAAAGTPPTRSAAFSMSARSASAWSLAPFSDRK